MNTETLEITVAQYAFSCYVQGCRQPHLLELKNVCDDIRRIQMYLCPHNLINFRTGSSHFVRINGLIHFCKEDEMVGT